jgi:hypothetical protein
MRPHIRSLNKTNLAFVINELDEVGIAASVTGSGRAKMRDIARMGEEIAEALSGNRPEVEKVRERIIKRAKDVRTSRVQQKPASKSIHALRDAVIAVEKLLKKGLGNAPVAYSTNHGLIIANDWGYADKALRPTLHVFDEADRIFDRKKLFKVAPATQSRVVLMPGSRFCDGHQGAYRCDPDRVRRTVSPLEEVFSSAAAIAWVYDLTPSDRDTWTEAGGLPAFETTLSNHLSGIDSGRDWEARLRVTLGLG